MKLQNEDHKLLEEEVKKKRPSTAVVRGGSSSVHSQSSDHNGSKLKKDSKVKDQSIKTQFENLSEVPLSDLLH